MALIANGTTIPSNGTINVNGTSLTKVVANGVTVWQKIKIILNHNSGNANSTTYQWRQDTAASTEVSMTANSALAPLVSFDCTGYSILTIKVYGYIDTIPEYWNENHGLIYVGMDNAKTTAVCHRAKDTSGTNTGTYTEGVAWLTTATVTLDISSLSGTHTLTARIIGNQSTGTSATGYLNIAYIELS